MTTERLLTLNEVLEMFHLSRSGERRMRKDGEMPPHVRIGRKIYYRLSTVEQWMASMEEVSQ